MAGEFNPEIFDREADRIVDRFRHVRRLGAILYDGVVYQPYFSPVRTESASDASDEDYLRGYAELADNVELHIITGGHPRDRIAMYPPELGLDD